MVKVIIAGHWQTRGATDLLARMRRLGQTLDGDGCEDSHARQEATAASLSATPTNEGPTFTAHEALRGGISEYMPGVHVETITFGGGEDFPHALAVATAHTRVGLTIPRDCTDAAPIGQEVTRLLTAGTPVTLEGGHGSDTTLWASFTQGALGWKPGSITTDTLGDALAQLRHQWGRAIPTMVTSTQRPLVGLSSVMAISPDLSPRTDTDPTQALTLRHALTRTHNTLTLTLPIAGQNPIDPASLPGSGAGGGIGAIIAALGGSLHECGTYLAHAYDLTTLLAKCDLLVITEPTLHSPHLAEASLDALTNAAAHHGVPVVAVSVESSLSRHELAQWGLHGSLLGADTPEALHYVGQRVAHTWLRHR